MTKEKLKQIQDGKSPKTGCFLAILILLGITFIILYK
jgi:hypothetical protein